MGGFSQQTGDPNSGGKVQSFLNQNKITTPTNSGQQQFGMPMQQSLGQSLTTSQGTAIPQTAPQASPQITQSPQLDQSAATGQNAYPNTIGSMDNTQNQPIPASMQAGKGKGA